MTSACIPFPQGVGKYFSNYTPLLIWRLGFLELTIIGGHSLRYPWSAISDWAWYRNVRYRTEDLKVRHYIGYRNKLLSDIRYPTLLYGNPRSAVVGCLVLVMKVVSSKPVRKIICQLNLLESTGNYFSILDIGISDIDLVRYRNGSLCRYRNYSDITD